jgi:endonuclease YncB( thermonuclease family)
MKRLTLLISCLIVCGVLSAEADAPPIGWTVPVRVIEVYDGDTVVVEITKRVRVRLLDCWAPEVRTKNPDEKAAGYASKDHLKEILPEGSSAVLHIPGSVDVGRSITFGRFLGRIWRDGDRDDVSSQQVAAGHATLRKGE